MYKHVHIFIWTIYFFKIENVIEKLLWYIFKCVYHRLEAINESFVNLCYRPGMLPGCTRSNHFLKGCVSTGLAQNSTVSCKEV